jgi:prevent-host-death family protein
MTVISTRFFRLDILYNGLYTLIMNAQYTISAARAALATIVDKVVAGRPVELTRHGEPVAVVVSKQQFEQMEANRPNFVERCLALRAKHGPEALLPDDWAASLRDRDPGREVSL